MDARDGERFKRACDELLQSVAKLRAGQSYYVFLFCWKTDEMFYDPSVQYVQVASQHEERLRRWIYDVSLGAGTDPRRALSLAERMKPDAVFLLSDGQFNWPRTPLSESGWIDDQGNRSQADVQTGIETFYRNIPVHTIAFENPFTVSKMQQIAEATGGKCRYIPTRSHAPVDAGQFREALRRIDQQQADERDSPREYRMRLSYARELITAGELVYAEYLIRPLRHADSSKITNPVLLARVLAILDAELGSTRLEDFELGEHNPILGRADNHPAPQKRLGHRKYACQDRSWPTWVGCEPTTKLEGPRKGRTGLRIAGLQPSHLPNPSER